MVAVCTLWTAWGGRLWAGPDGTVFAGAGAQDGCAEVVLLVPEGRPGVGVLAADGVTPLHIGGLRGGGLRGGPALPVRVRWEPGRAAALLLHPYTGAHLAAPPPGQGQERGEASAHGMERLGHEAFRVDAAAEPAPGLAGLMARLGRFASAPLTGPAVLALLEGGIGPDAAAAFGAYARLLPLDQLRWLAAALLHSRRACANLAAAFPGDPWAEALPGLAAWNAVRPPAARLDADPAADLSVAGHDGVHVSFPHLCSSLARRAVAPRKTVAVLATARNEGPYLLEWVAHHRSIGAEHIFIYSNGNDDGSEALLNALAQAGVITWISNPVPPGRVAQFQAYGHAFGVLPHILDYRWTVVVDLDEMLVLDAARFASLPEYLAFQDAQPVDAVAFNWVVFGSNGEARWRDAPLAKRFGHRMPYTDDHVKVAVRSGLPMHAHPHRAVFDPRQAVSIRNASGGPYRHQGDPSLSAEPEETAAWINHYFFKSAEEFAWKASRNRGDQPVRGASADLDLWFAEAFLEQHGSPTLLPDTRLVLNSDARTQALEALLGLPGVFQAHQAVRFIFGEQLAARRQRLREDAAGAAEGSLERRLAAAAGAWPAED